MTILSRSFFFEFTDLEVQCDNPGAPQNGYAQGSAPYRAGDVVQFNCNPEYMMQGQPIIACQDNGRWSGGLPKCNFSYISLKGPLTRLLKSILNKLFIILLIWEQER